MQSIIKHIPIIKKIKILKIILIPLSLMLIWSAYNAYTKEINPIPETLIELSTNSKKIFVNDVFNVQIKFDYISESNLNEKRLKSFLQEISNSAHLISYNVYHEVVNTRLGEKFRSFLVSANYIANSTDKSKRILYRNDNGTEIPISGEFPEIYLLNDYDFQVDLPIIYPGVEFVAELILRNVSKNIPAPILRFEDAFASSKPITIGTPKIVTTKGRHEELILSIRQKFQAVKQGTFYLQPISIKISNQPLVLKTFYVNVSELNITHNVTFKPPQKVNEIFNIEVILSNCPRNPKTPIFPKIFDCKKLDLDVREEDLGNRLYNYIFTQKYRTEYDGQYNAGEVIIFKGDKRIEHLLGLFTVEFDCSSADINRPQSGIEPIKGAGFVRDSDRNIIVTNNTDEDIFLKLINNFKKKSIRTKYIRKYESATINNLPAGTFYLACSSGSHWDIKNKRFRCNKEFFVFDKYDDLMTFSYMEYGNWKFKIYKERTYSYSSGPKDISETSFENF